MFPRITAGIYKSTLRKARLFDKEPILKTLISIQSFDTYYSGIVNANEEEYKDCRFYVSEFLEHKNYYTFNKSLYSFVRESMRIKQPEMPIKGDINTLIRLSDYLDSKIVFAKGNSITESLNKVTLPSPRDIRNLFDDLSPEMVTEELTDYNGYMLMQNPSVITQLKDTSEVNSKQIHSIIVSLIMYPLKSINNTNQIIFIGDSVPPSRESVLLKKKLVKMAISLHGETVDTCDQSTDKIGSYRRRRQTDLGDELQSEINKITVKHVIPKNEDIDSYLHPEEDTEKIDAIVDSYNYNHVILGGDMSNPIVIFDRNTISPDILSHISYRDEGKDLSISFEYSQILHALSKENKPDDQIPLCLACCTNTMRYPFDYIRDEIKNGNIVPVKISNIQSLLFNNTIDRRQIYPNILKKLGGEISKCAEAVFKIINEFD